MVVISIFASNGPARNGIDSDTYTAAVRPWTFARWRDRRCVTVANQSDHGSETERGR